MFSFPLLDFIFWQYLWLTDIVAASRFYRFIYKWAEFQLLVVFWTAETDQIGSDIGRSEAVVPIIDESVGQAEAGPPTDVSSEGDTERSDTRANTRLEANAVTSEAAANSTEHRPPSSPMMDLETDFPSGETSFKLKSVCYCSFPFLYTYAANSPSVCECAQNHLIRSRRHHSEE